MHSVVIASGVRTPIGKAGSAYADVHAVDLLARVLSGAVDAAGAPPDKVDQVLVGCTQQAGNQALNVARNGWLAAGLPIDTAATTVDSQCGSSQQSVNLAAALIEAGQADLVVAGGVESLTRVPASAAADAAGGEPFSPAQLDLFDMPHQGIGGERVARKYGIDRETSDAFGLRSHRAADAAWNDGRFKSEIVELERDGRVLLARDEGIRPDSSPERLAALSPVYTDDGIITAATASQLSDGAAALLLASEEACEKHGLEPLARIRRATAVGVDPDIMMEGPIVATQMMLELEGLQLDDIDLFEIHEAYASVVCAWRTQFPIEDARLNIDGGAISIGHPFGASGARQLAHLVHTLVASGGGRGLQAMCCGGGIGTGSILETL